MADDAPSIPDEPGFLNKCDRVFGTMNTASGRRGRYQPDSKTYLSDHRCPHCQAWTATHRENAGIVKCSSCRRKFLTLKRHARETHA